MPHTRLFTAEQEAEIARQYVAGAAPSDLGREWGTTQITLRRVLRRQGVYDPNRPRKRGYTKRTPMDRYSRADWERWYVEERRPLAEIAQMLGINSERVRKQLIRHGIPRRGRRFYYRDKPIEAATLQRTIRDHWLTAPAAAELLGIRKDTLCEYLRDGRLPGAFRLDESRNSPWLIPRAVVEERLRERRQS